MDFIILAVLASVVLLGMAAISFGVDTRTGFLDPRAVDPWTRGS